MVLRLVITTRQYRSMPHIVDRWVIADKKSFFEGIAQLVLGRGRVLYKLTEIL
jgi:hypothetical protein